MEYIKVTCLGVNTTTKEILTALLDSENYIGFEDTADTLLGYIEKDKFDEAFINELKNTLSIAIKTEIIKEENWNALWESNFEPILVNDQVYIRAAFHEERKDIPYDLLITPKMSFGTGHHQTTQMMIQHMLGIDFTHKTVFDFGTGTGVLAILAEKLGATNILAVDIDTWSVENSIENLARNFSKNIIIQQGGINLLTKTYDCILANINLHIITESLSHFYTHLAPDGDLIISGFLYSDLMELEPNIQKAGFSIVAKKEEQYWSSLHLRKSL